MKKILPIALIFLISCGKETTKPEVIPDGTVNYTIEGDSIHIVDSSSFSIAKWIFVDVPPTTKGYGLQAYYAKPGGEILYKVSFFIETDKIETGRVYSDGVTGSILRNSTDYASTKELPGTYIRIDVNKQKDQTLTGTFTATLKNLNTNEFVEISGSFDNVKLTE